ncbi:MAG: acetate/propionate family kinase [Thermoguttaceae bacterium]|jgi:acetate kinase
MADDGAIRVLTINSGSSSLKWSLYHMGPAETRVLAGSLERIGLRGGVWHIRDADGKTLVDEAREFPDHDAALKTLLDWLEQRFPGRPVDAVGHRVVHGGPTYTEPHLVTAELLETLEEIIRLAPEHLPHELKAIDTIRRLFPAMKQVACFDTAFHRHMPEVAQRIPMPRSLWNEGVLRYGFHGLSYEYIVSKLREIAGPQAANGRVLIAHLGNGASMAAVREGRGIDTTMGLTPAGGLMMGTRSGDLDPGIIIYLLQEKGRSPSTIDYLVNQRSGLIGVSGSSSDMRDLLGREAADPHAAQAVEMFCYQARKFVAAMAAALGGLDTFVFTAGVGTNAPEVRRRICSGLEFMGIHIDAARNEANAPIISTDESPVTVRVMKTDEELTIARHSYKLLNGRQDSAPLSRPKE